MCGSGHYGMPIVLEAMLPLDYLNHLEYVFWKEADILGNCPLLCWDMVGFEYNFTRVKGKGFLESLIREPFAFENKVINGHMNTIN